MFQYTQGMIDDFWFQLQNAYSIEPRSYFEEKYPTCPLMMALHYVWKREMKENPGGKFHHERDIDIDDGD